MSDEAKKLGENGEWQMPEPVFRSSEGYTPKAAGDAPDDDFPTDPGFDDEAPTEAPNKAEDSDSPQSVRAASKTKVRHQKKKKRGCLKSMALMVLIIVASVALIIATLVYFIFYSGPRSGPF